MQRILVSVLALSILTCAANPVLAESKSKAVDPNVKANQQVLSAANKSGVRSQDLRELGAALKQDASLGDAVQGAIQNGLKGKELSQFVRQQISERKQQATAGANEQAAGRGRGAGQGMGMGQGQGMQGMGMGQGEGMQGMGRGQGQGMQGMGRGQGQGMQGMGRGQCMGPGMQGTGQGTGMQGTGSGMGRGMGSGMGRGMGRR